MMPIRVRRASPIAFFVRPSRKRTRHFTKRSNDNPPTTTCDGLVEQANLHPRPEEVDVFLAMDEHGAGVHGRSGSRPLAWTSAKIPPLHAPDGPGEK